MKLNVNSEIGELEGVIIHTPGDEVENMTPQNAERALYSDILNLSVASEEYEQFKGVLQKATKVFEVFTLLSGVLSNKEAKEKLLTRICQNENVLYIKDYLASLTNDKLAKQLIEGVPLTKDTLTKYMTYERYALQPLHNFFFTRDSAVTIGDQVLIAKMRSTIRTRESIIMDTIFECHPDLKTKTISPLGGFNPQSKISIEGGDILVASENILLIGFGPRTSTQGIDFIIDHYKKQKGTMNIIVQELPNTPESFIHLDMVFTIVDKDKCVIYEPVIYNQHDFETLHISINNGSITIREETNILTALKKLGMDLEPIKVGSNTNDWIQEREQWHSGANFFALTPGKVMSYGRNVYTLEELNNHGFEIITAKDIIEERYVLDNYEKMVVTVDGAELARGGGGCRCMTMPIRRKGL